MDKKMNWFAGGALAIAFALALPAAAQTDLATSEGQLEAYVRMRADLTGKEVFADWNATIFAVLPGEKPRAILKTYGYNVSRMEKQADGGYHWISREVSYYRDVQTGKLLDTWTNPITGETVDVVHVANDPVNHKFPSPKQVPFSLPWQQHGEMTSMLLDMPLEYPNPLQPDAYPKQSTGKVYLASEHFGYMVRTADLVNQKLASAPVYYNWFRTGPWLPWMNMGGKQGYLLYSGVGSKLSGWDALPADVREYTLKHFPLFRHAPAEYVSPNMTSWIYYRKLQEAKAAAGK